MIRSLLILSCAVSLAACGDSPSGAPDMAMETPPDLSMTADDLAPTTDDLSSPPDFTIPCVTEGSACTLPAGGNGVCKVVSVGQPVTCQGCGTALNDAACIAAYGPGVAYLCLNDACVPGDCRTSTDCAAGKVCLNNFCSPCTGATDTEGDTRCKSDARYGATTLCLAGVCTVADCRTDSDCAVPGGGGKTKICGVSVENECGSCVNDSQCQGDTDTTGTAGANSMCEISSGACISRSCTVGGNSYCTTANPGDVCCGGTCQTGTCCGAGGGVNCNSGGCSSTNPAKAGVCTTCDAVAGTTWYVDPQNGNDQTGTGSRAATGNPAPACAFKTITRALQFIGGAPPVGTKIVVLGDSSVSLYTSGDGEKYPIRLPSNVEVSAMTGPIQINNNSAFSVIGTGVTIKGFKIATSVVKSYGIDVAPGASVTIGSVEVSGFSGAGIVSKGGQIILGDGTTLKNNTGDGALVATAGRITVDLRTTAPLGGVRFEGNTGYGVVALDRGELILRGNGNAATPTVQVLNNVKGGVRVESRTLAELRGIVITGSTTGSGVDTYPEAMLKIAESTILNNKLGVAVNPAGALTNIGTILVEESNTLQVAPGGSIAPNSVVGLCVAAGHVPLGAPPTKLLARRNIFAGPRDCRTANPGSVSSLTACTGTRSDVAVVKLPNLTAPLLLLDNCTF